MAPRRSSLIGRILLFLSALLWAAVALGYWSRLDALSALTAWPVWAWSMLGLLLAAFALAARTRRHALALAGLWLLWTALVAEEPASLLRAGFGGRAVDERLRVVTLNCCGGSAAAAAEVVACHPDVVLLQESPARKDAEDLARRLFGKRGGAVWGPDASIVARGDVRRLALDRDVAGCCTSARVTVRPGFDIAVASVRLAPPVFLTDLWSPSCWRAYADDRCSRRAEASAVATAVRDVAGRLPVVIGGDMNAPAGDGSLRPFSAWLHDCGRSSGVGWGNTVLNDFPVLRFDQVWASGRLRASSVTAHRTVFSDHRLVVCDFAIR